MNHFKPYALLPLLFAILFVSCEKEGTVDLIAVAQQYNGGSKVHVEISGNQGYACWNVGDQVKVNATTATISLTTANDSTTARINGIQKNNNGDYYAICPASFAGSGAFSSGSTITLPSTQKYRVVGDHQVLDAPMVAKADGELVMKFVNLCYLLKVHIDQCNNKLSSLTVSTNNTPLCGTAQVTFVGTTPSLGSLSNGSNSVTLEMSTPVSLNKTGGTDFYIALPPMAVGTTLQITAKDMFGNTPQLSTALSVSQAIPNNIIINVNGPTVSSNTEYTFYDWIWSKQSGYIDLGVKPAVGAKMELTFMIPTDNASALSAAQYLCGSRDASVRWFSMEGGNGNASNGFAADVAGKQMKFQSSPNNFVPREAGVKYTMSVASSQVSGKIKGTATLTNLSTGEIYNQTSGPSQYNDFPSNVPNVVLFAEMIPSGSENYYHKSMKCYSFKYYNGTNLVHNFVPCERNNDHVVGVYDLAGSGGFITPTRRNNTATAFQVGND